MLQGMGETVSQFGAAKIGVHRFCGEGPASLAHAEEAMALSTEQGFAFWGAWGTILRGRTLAEQGHADAGMVQMQRGLVAYEATGATVFRPAFLALLAEMYGQVGQYKAGLATLTEALQLVDKTGECWYEPELHRLRGELMLHQSAQHQEAVESCFHQAIAIARQQGAKSMELRAALSLSRLWQQQDKQDTARALLTPIYGWFSEGFHTADLQEAKALLEALDNSLL